MALRWGILGTGNIANTFATALKVAKKGSLVAVGSRSKSSAEAFGQTYGLEASQCHGSYEAVLQDPAVDIVYICSPHPCHHAMALQAAAAKKHMLVEKPIAMTEAQVRDIIKACQANNVFLMEAYMYRCHPQTRLLVDLVRAGDKIGQVKLIKANFSFDGRSLGPSSRLWRNELGGGAIMDIGGFPNLWRPDLTVLGPVQIEYKSHSKSEVEIIPVTMDETNLFAIEADAVADALADEQLRECKYMTLDDTLGQVRAMDQWRKEVGLRYQEDQD
ncbi:hypothetical protein [Absidia glauca]|uniref:D-xylose 1-dehydrogenase (NADP(+), D-xylono-1,5-lactone-forming) n=1 Tax=Absidia glauca TaxID=4829 RepID=A0A168QG00_ABSGL|nr:hypothetical protein [Absidia glauca]